MANRLSDSTSPYLLQHKDNPVDWYPWCDEALQRAKQEDKPIFLSIGYSACHWCHVMERESFENEAIAHQLNTNFICIKVDREERPDLDHIYMQSVQIMTRRGGWPMSVFLTPDLQPFFGGTYWPPTQRMGMPGFNDVIDGVVDAWNNRREAAIGQGEKITALIQRNQSQDSATELDESLLSNAVESLVKSYDEAHGGFGKAPKFPHPMDVRFLLRMSTGPDDREYRMAMHTLDCMANGGIFDHLGGGFARYSVDRFWLVPHFEKMLYDNSLLMEAYVEAFQVTGLNRYRDVVEDVANYLLRDLRDAAGGFYSTEDADSEGVEGKFYVWQPNEIRDLLGQRSDRFCQAYNVTDAGNFEGSNILHLKKTLSELATDFELDADELATELAECREILFQQREHRIRPGKDDKVLTNWNGLAIQAMTRAAMSLKEPRFLRSAIEAARFVDGYLKKDNGRLLHTYRNGKSHVDAFLDDYAYLIQAYVTLYEATFDETWITLAIQLADIIMADFLDQEAGSFFYTAAGQGDLISRTKEIQDASIPSSNAMTATALTRLGWLAGKNEYLDAARRTIENTAPLLKKVPAAFGQMLIAAHLWLKPASQWVLVGDLESQRDVIDQLRSRFLPSVVIAGRTPADPITGPLDDLFRDRIAVDGELTLYRCTHFQCDSPIVGRDAVLDVVNA